MEYSKLNLWLNNSEIADSWLTEYESNADKPDKLGTTIRAVRLQLHENQVCTRKTDYTYRDDSEFARSLPL